MKRNFGMAKAIRAISALSESKARMNESQLWKHKYLNGQVFRSHV